MHTITQNEIIAKLPHHELKASLSEFLRPLSSLLPDVRLPAVAELTVQGIVSSESAVITQIAGGVAHPGRSVWAASKRITAVMGR